MINLEEATYHFDSMKPGFSEEIILLLKTKLPTADDNNSLFAIIDSNNLDENYRMQTITDI